MKRLSPHFQALGQVKRLRPSSKHWDSEETLTPVPVIGRGGPTKAQPAAGETGTGRLMAAKLLAPVTGRDWAKRGAQPISTRAWERQAHEGPAPSNKDWKRKAHGSPAPSSKERERRGQERRPAAHNKDWERHDHDGSSPNITSH